MRLKEQMAEHGLALQLTEDAKDLLVAEGYDPAMGARPLRRAIQRLIEDPLADEVLKGNLPEGTVIVVDRDGEQMKLIPTLPEEPTTVGVAASETPEEGPDSEPAES